MHIAASSPLSIDKDDLEKNRREKKDHKSRTYKLWKKNEMVEKISQGKINKFISDNTLLNQIWIMDPKKKVKIFLMKIKVLKI